MRFVFSVAETAFGAMLELGWVSLARQLQIRAEFTGNHSTSCNERLDVKRCVCVFSSRCVHHDIDQVHTWEISIASESATICSCMSADHE